MTPIIPIDHDVPIPPVGTNGVGRGRPRKYPFAELEVGDSFFVPDGDGRKLSGAAGFMKKRLGYQFMVRSVLGGVRVWRTA